MFKRKSKYKFDEDKLIFIVENKTFYQKLISSLLAILPGFIISFLFLFIFLNTIDSPLEKKLQANIDTVLYKMEILKTKMSGVNVDIDRIADNDNTIYRPFFEMDSIPSSIRKAGFGGIDNYKNLKVSENADLLINLSKNIDILTKQLYIQSISFDEIIRNIENKEEMQQCIPTHRPVKLDKINAVCSFGMRMHPLLGIYRMHKGVDLCAPDNTEIFAAGKGVVTRKTFHESLGNYIIINHGYGYETVYGHLNKALVAVGDTVQKGDLIALMGTTGISTVVHLHYEVHKNGKAIDPMKLYFWDLTEVEYQCMISNNTEAVSFFMN